MIARATTRPINHPTPLELKVSSDPAMLASVRKAIESLAERMGFEQRVVSEIGLCVNEALANMSCVRGTD
jgi:hypothetical protein